jgi:hypothetical protein
MDETPEVPDFIARAIEAQGKVTTEEVRELLGRDDLTVTYEYEEEQVTMELGEPEPIRWEEFFTGSEVAATKRVRRGQQQLGPLARAWIAARCGGTIGDGSRSAKQFVNTPRGKFRISLSADGDNTTETAAHERMGAETVAVEDVLGMTEFFNDHGLPGRETYQELRAHLHERLRQA